MHQIIVLDLPPSANVYWKHGGPHRVYISKEAQDYRLKVMVACRQQNIQLMTGPLVMSIYAAMSSVDRDLGNTEKVLSDALQGYAFADDNQLTVIHQYRCEAPEPKRKNAYVVVGLTDAPPDFMQTIFNRMFKDGKRRDDFWLNQVREA